MPSGEPSSRSCDTLCSHIASIFTIGMVVRLVQFARTLLQTKPSTLANPAAIAMICSTREDQVLSALALRSPWDISITHTAMVPYRNVEFSQLFNRKHSVMYQHRTTGRPAAQRWPSLPVGDSMHCMTHDRRKRELRDTGRCERSSPVREHVPAISSRQNCK